VIDFSKTVRKAMFDALKRHQPVVPLDHEICVLANDTASVSIGSFGTFKATTTRDGTIVGFDLDKNEFVFKDGSRLPIESGFYPPQAKPVHRRFVHRDQARYPGLAWEIDTDRKCWEVLADGTRRRDTAASPYDYLNKVGRWWREVEGDWNIPVATQQPEPEPDPRQDVPVTTSEDAW
jgi:hypothetical protein